MAFEANATKFSRYITEVYGEGKLDLIDELCAPDCTLRGPHLPTVLRGTAAMKRGAAGFRALFPDMQVTVEDVVAGEDHVVVRWTIHATHRGGPLFGLPATGQEGRFTNAVIALFHLADGKIVDYWDHPDLLSMFRQLGAPPTFTPPTS